MADRYCRQAPGSPAGHLRRSTTFAVVVIAAFAVGVLVAVLGGGIPATRQPNGGEWLVQAALLLAVTVLLVVRLRRKG
ncbi:MAG TPA: hypothetical protein VJS19_03280 [Candidatus Dormibacteraeota bacterium]|nr:hypothetical protein [Candidatus Dormibacteraeota bacterium]